MHMCLVYLAPRLYQNAHPDASYGSQMAWGFGAFGGWFYSPEPGLGLSGIETNYAAANYKPKINMGKAAKP